MTLVGTLISSGRSCVWRCLCAASVPLPHRASRALGLCRTGMVRLCRALSTSARQPASGCSFRLPAALALWVMDTSVHARMQSARRRSACTRSEGLPSCERSSSTESGGGRFTRSVWAALAHGLPAPESCSPRPMCRNLARSGPVRPPFAASPLPSAGRRRPRSSQIRLTRPRSCAL